MAQHVLFRDGWYDEHLLLSWKPFLKYMTCVNKCRFAHNLPASVALTKNKEIKKKETVFKYHI